ncbi:MAG: 50S ribosomal protein L4 [Helicobacteraceae bacterium]|jgi:large subunit ribosomal protein L4|nr:50S ribosomal protein L4 [Helicobacteraceae bacterium]
MSKAVTLNEQYEPAGDFALPEAYESISEQNLYLYVKSFLGAIRQNGAHTKTRAAVSGTDKKPFAQKGGGRARQGSLKGPTFVGGGTAFGPKNSRNYVQKVNKKQKRLALLYALNKKASEGSLLVIDSLKIESSKTKEAFKIAAKLAPRDGLFVVLNINENSFRAFRNLPNHYLMEAGEINAYIVASYRVIVIEKAALEQIIKEG